MTVYRNITRLDLPKDPIPLTEGIDPPPYVLPVNYIHITPEERKFLFRDREEKNDA